MAVNWDGVSTTEDQWMALEGCPFDCLEDVRGQQSATSTRALMELLHRLDCPQTPCANLTKPKMASIIVRALAIHEGWALATLSNVLLATSSRDVADSASLAFSLELSIKSPLQIFFPASGIPPPEAEGHFRMRMWSPWASSANSC